MTRRDCGASARRPAVAPERGLVVCYVAKAGRLALDGQRRKSELAGAQDPAYLRRRHLKLMRLVPVIPHAHIDDQRYGAVVHHAHFARQMRVRVAFLGTPWVAQRVWAMPHWPSTPV